MATHFIKQPNDLFAEWSSISDSFETLNSTPEEIIEYKVQEYREEITEKINKICNALKNNEKPFRGNTMSWNKALQVIRKIHGKDSEEVKFALSYDEPVL